MPDRRTFFKQGLAVSAAWLLKPEWMEAEQKSLTSTGALPDKYFRRLAKWCPVVIKKLKDGHGASLHDLEAEHGWYHLPYMVLPSALLYSRQNPANPFYKKPEMLKLAFDLGDLMAREDKDGTFAPRLDSYRDVYMWLEAYALLKDELGEERRKSWSAAMERNVSFLLPEMIASKDMPAYTENFIASSPNHLAWWAATVMIAGLYLQKREWVALGGGILKRFASTEQNADGYWGEHNPNGPTGGYNYLTAMAVGVYWEHTKDPDALKALRRATDFHANLTYPDGNLIELFNDRNRYWHVSYWGQFAFSSFPDGRGYAELLMRNVQDEEIDVDCLGLLGMNALYYHNGPSTAPPPLQASYRHQLKNESGVVKDGPWVIGMSGIMDTPLPRSQWFLDRQSNLSLFHEKTGLILSGANSKHQPQLSTFSEKLENEWVIEPKGTRLAQFQDGSALAIAFNTFSAELSASVNASQDETVVRAQLSGRGKPPQEGYFALQLVLKPGQVLRTGTGKTFKVSEGKIDLSAQEIGGSIEHNGWVLKPDAEATLQWPVYPYNPYRNAPETKIEYAVALLRVPLKLKADAHHWMQPDEQTIQHRFQVAK
ncbi:hypothetical protein [Terriglobus tenax]|uniref:hypothetical protein n=1 Tax=Terriglobus tenax TaxID=1111115 RepID=UPI0021DF6CF8|nr:hypothetical protein [Terriglobus tenax]